MVREFDTAFGGYRIHVIEIRDLQFACNSNYKSLLRRNITDNIYFMAFN